MVYRVWIQLSWSIEVNFVTRVERWRVEIVAGNRYARGSDVVGWELQKFIDCRHMFIQHLAMSVS